MTKMLLLALCYATMGVVLVSPLVGVADAFAPQPLQRTKTKVAAAATNTALHLRVAYQGEPGAYSEKSTRELLGDNVVAIGKPNFEACFRAVAAMEVDYCCLPIENSLGGSIHENYDLMLRYDLTICAEHEFRVQHCVLAKEGVKLPDSKNDVGSGENSEDGTTVAKYAISHPQALAQCDNYLRSLGITPIPTYDTAGSAKMIQDDDLPDRCTPENTIAIGTCTCRSRSLDGY
jgi:prephenate dehydratase